MASRTGVFAAAGAAALLAPLALLAAEIIYAAPLRVDAHRFRLDYRGTSGSLVLADFAVNEQGEPRDVRIRHGGAPFTVVVRDSLLEGWTVMVPEEARAEAEEVRVAAVVLFRQPQLLAVKPPEYKVPQVYEGPTVPPQPRRVEEPGQPPNVTSDGVAVLGVRIDEAGTVVEAVPLFGGREFVRAAQAALPEWDFAPARRDHKLVESGLLIVVYFPRPSL